MIENLSRGENLWYRDTIVSRACAHRENRGPGELSILISIWRVGEARHTMGWAWIGKGEYEGDGANYGRCQF